jgi:pimeloyl-ACP methyl ester carboxylesterase
MERPPVVIGHSMGGMVVQHYLASHPAPAAVLLASAPPRGLIPATLRIARRRPLPLLRATLTLRLIHTIGTPDLYREAFFSSDISQDAVKAYHVQVQDESFRAYLDMLWLNLPRPERVDAPLLVLGTRDEQLILPREVEATARAYNTRAEFFSGMGHVMMLDVGWQDVADRILEWLGERGL